MARFASTAGRSARDINFENTVRAREGRTNANLQNPGMSGVLAAPGWDAFWGGMDRAEEDAHAQGKNFSVNWGNFGNGNETMPNQRFSLQRDEDSARNIALNDYLTESGQRFQLGKARIAQEQAQTQAAQDAVFGANNDRQALDYAFSGGRDPMKTLPGHLQPALAAQQLDQDIRRQTLTDSQSRLAETERHNRATEAGAGGFNKDTDAQAIADAIMRGERSPETGNLGRGAVGAVDTALAKAGYNQAAAVTDWKATQKHIQTMNGSQQLRLSQAVNSLPEMLDSVESLANQWKGGKFPILNRGNLMAAKAGAYGPEAASVANRLEAQIADVNADLGVVYMGGNSPTDHALQLASKSLSGDWDEKVMRDMIGLARNNVKIRRNSIANTGVAGASADNVYAKPAAPAAATAPAAAPAGGGVKLQAPDGSVSVVSAAMVDHYLAKGAKRVQ